jgi:hypothetical protein
MDIEATKISNKICSKVSPTDLFVVIAYGRQGRCGRGRGQIIGFSFSFRAVFNTVFM